MAHHSTEEKGRVFQNEQEGRHFDNVRRDQKASKKAPKAKSEEADEHDAPMHEIVKAHGPAHTTKIEKAENSDTYSVHSQHEDGHKHTSDGHSLHEAHQHSMQAHGEEGGMEGEPDGDEGEGMPMMHGGGGGMTPPGM